MAKSRKRKGHNKRVTKRNNELKSKQLAMQKIMSDAMAKELEQLKQQMEEQSGSTEDIQVVEEQTEQ